MDDACEIKYIFSTDSWISQSASFPRNQKQPGVDSPSPAAPLPKPPCQSSSGSQQPQRTMKVTCANCKKPLKKGQTAYQRKGSTHLFCSTTCLSAFSHKPTPKKSCTMCKKYAFYEFDSDNLCLKFIVLIIITLDHS